jgi:multidrug efflux system membrane fusion protein
MSQPAPTRRRWFLYGLVALIFATGVWYFGFHAEAPKGSGGPSFRMMRKANTAVPVRAVAVKRQPISVHLRAIGTVTPLNTVTVRPRVDGQLLSIAFTEGQQVKQGDVLVEVDPLPFQIRLAQVEGQHRQNLAQAQTVRADLERFKLLNQQTLVTQQQLEAQQALLTEKEGAIAASQALVDDARRQLAYTKVDAPISGRLGLRQVDVGNLVRSTDVSGIAVITQTKPISVLFTIPENDLQKVIEPLRRGEKLEVEAYDRTEKTRLAVGSLKTVDNQIDLSTGTLRLKAEFANDDEKLFPNQFVNVRMRVSTEADAIVVPTAVVQYGSRGTYVYMVNAESQATVRDVVLGPSDGNFQAVKSGLNPGDQVIIEGVDRLREGRPVTLVGDEAPKSPKGEGKGGRGEKGGKGGGGRGEKGEKGEKGGRGEKSGKSSS